MGCPLKANFHRQSLDQLSTDIQEKIYHSNHRQTRPKGRRTQLPRTDQNKYDTFLIPNIKHSNDNSNVTLILFQLGRAVDHTITRREVITFFYILLIRFICAREINLQVMITVIDYYYDDKVVRIILRFTQVKNAVPTFVRFGDYTSSLFILCQ